MFVKAVLCSLAIALSILVGKLLILWLKRLRDRIQRISACGYFADQPKKWKFALLILMLRLLIFIQVGKVRVIGRENLDQSGGQIIVCPNHPHYVDGAIFPVLIRRPGRYMVDEDVLRFVFGLGALLLVPLGAFPVRDGTRSGILRARDTGVRSLASGYPLLIFPEGHTTFDLKLLPFKKGAIRIAKMAASSSGKSVSIVPAYIKYGRDAGNWIRRIKPPLQYLLVLLGFLYFRRGATVVFGQPISSEDFPASDKEACSLLQQKILSLNPAQTYGVDDAGIYEIFAFTKL